MWAAVAGAIFFDHQVVADLVLADVDAEGGVALAVGIAGVRLLCGAGQVSRQRTACFGLGGASLGVLGVGGDGEEADGRGDENGRNVADDARVRHGRLPLWVSPHPILSGETEAQAGFSVNPGRIPGQDHPGPPARKVQLRVGITTGRCS
ncbi:hypothetical protein LRS10_11765 [Phenylobacterium sp. J426]|nr:hypothetical protein [Phenylobacterium sp. J426]MCR5874784.1 hypothetical protein [Phenylobacterium sp. J426]